MAETRGDKYALPLSLLTQDQLHHHLASLTGVGSSEFYTKTASILNEKQPRIVIANSVSACCNYPWDDHPNSLL
jgi:hypothetical protein